MVIHIDRPVGFRGALRYNERKVEAGLARCIYAGNFILDADRLSFGDKVDRLGHLDRLRPDYRNRAIHVSLAFHPSDRPDREKMIQVARDYIRELGFASQPWLLYEHRDTRAPHAHIVASRVTAEGEILSTYTEFNRLRTNLRELEIDHSLVPSERRSRNPQLALASAKPVRPVHGEALTRDAIGSTLAYVLPNYRYSNLTELNAILRQYGIWADNGKPGGALAAARGLSYQMLDPEGRPVSKRVGAGAIGFNPGLDYLEGRFRDNARMLPEGLGPLSSRVQLAGLRAGDDWHGFAAALRTAGIEPVPFMNKQGQVYDIVFVDHSRKMAASADRLGNPASLRQLYTPLVKGLEHQYRLVQDMNSARQRLLIPPSDEDVRTLHLRQERQHRISR
ncbi:MAG TPA: relaxase/mobilization nuclease domain-containing protein [Puia sp.]|uniref:relaxase/mobilization nuclease domain-containing protein n=1 Tax=Puia sp. TaxID=2045100 RepID=UPI002C718EA5|nr:relaxase/mobilization nuclease domain-containing protein [Puia sp.]HVU97984.1 relaxase/mobilization nuclease domain-containing protein [Puia sp.]